MSILKNKLTNFPKKLFIKAISRTNALPIVSLTWGSHRKEFGLERNISENALLDESYSCEIFDPVIAHQKHSYFHPEQHAWKLSNSIVDPKSGLTICSEMIVKETINFGNPSKIMLKSLSKNIQISKFTPISTVKVSTYYHWMIEELPAALKIREYNQETKFIIDLRNAPKYIEETLKYYKLEYINDSRLHSAEDVIVVNRSQSGWPRKSDVQQLNNQMPSLHDEHGRDQERKLYISRAKSRRPLPDEYNLEIELRKRNFQVVYLEELSWTEQVLLVQSASFIVGPHGAGLANLAFAQEGIPVLEIMFDDYANPCFQILSITKNLQYEKILIPSNISGDVLSNLVLTRIDQITSRTFLSQIPSTNS